MFNYQVVEANSLDPNQAEQNVRLELDPKCFDSLKVSFTPFLVSGNFCRMVITFTNSLDPDQDQHVRSGHVGPGWSRSGFKLFDTLTKEILEKVYFEQKQEKYPACK